MRPKWNEVLGYSLIIVAAGFWGGAASLGKHLMSSGISTTMLMQVRSLFSSAIVILGLLFFARSHLRISLKDLPVLLLLAIPGLALLNLSYYYAIRLVPVAIAVFIQFTGPVLVFVYGLLSKREQSSISKIFALLLSSVGTYLMVQMQPAQVGKLPWLGITSAILSMILFAFNIILSHGLSKRFSTWTLVAYGYGIATVFWCILQNPIQTAGQLTDLALWSKVILFSIFSTLIPFSLYLLGLRRVTATGGAIASTSETVAASLFAFFFLNERLSFWQMAGAALILVAVLILIYQRPQTPIRELEAEKIQD